MTEIRKSRQIPTGSVILPYHRTKGKEAVNLYNKTAKEAQEWQELLLYDILAQNTDKLWIHTKFGYSVPRRNGKNEIVAIREMWGLKHGEKILHSSAASARSPTSSSTTSGLRRRSRARSSPTPSAR